MLTAVAEVEREAMLSQACVPLQSVHTIHCQTLSDALSIPDS